MGSYTFRMPDIGEGIVEVEVIAWHAAVGDTIEEDALLAEVMTDKATVEITSPVTGVVQKIGCDAGSIMTIGADFVVFETDASVSDNKSKSPAARLDSRTESNRDSELDNNADKPTESAPSFETPSLPPDKPKLRVDIDGTIPPLPQGTNLPPARTPEIVKNQAQISPVKPLSRDDDIADETKVLASPVVRRLARDLNLHLASIAGTGAAGRITKQDIRALLTVSDGDLQNTTSAQANAAKAGAGTSEDLMPAVAPIIIDADNEIERVPVIGVRRLIAQRMQAAKQQIPHFSYVEEVNIEALETTRQQLNENRGDAQEKLSLLHFVIHAICESVIGWPQCNARFDDENDVLEQYKRVHMGVATMTENGLMVPVIRNACQLDVWQLAAEVNRLAAAARQGTLSREELTGSTITVTSLGALAGVATTPIINRPETAIIGPNKMMNKLELFNGEPVNVRVMNISSSFDHRVVDGYDAACFIQDIRTRLEKRT